MNIPNHYFLAAILATFIAGPLIRPEAGAAITGINTANSLLKFTMNDSTSFKNGNPGTALFQGNHVPWNGFPYSSGLQVLPITQDSTALSYQAFNTQTTYGLDIQNITCAQDIGNTGFIDFTIEYRIEYQTDGGGLPLQALFIPQFNVSGSVQTTASLATFLGHVSYSSGINGPIETISYGYGNNTPGTFTNVPVIGTPLNSVTTISLSPFDTLIVGGFFTLHVDPASITVETVPEPTATVLALCSLPLLWRRRRA